MSGKTLTAVLLLAAGVGAYHYATKVDPLDRLLAVPESASAASDRRGGIVEADPLPPLADAVEPDHHTVFIFYSTQCPACVQLLSQLGPFVRLRPDVAVRRVNLGPQWSSEDAQVKYGINIRSVPHVVIYDADGELMAEDDGRDKAGLAMLSDWMHTEQLRSSGSEAP